MNFEFDSDKPIYKQLVDQIKLMIVTNEYKLGEKLPSVREFALMTRVNPNTIQRALTELEEDGLIVTKRTSGKFVTEDKKLLEKERNSLAEEVLDKFFIDMENLGIEDKEIISIVERRGEK